MDAARSDDPYQVHADATPVLSRASSTPRLSLLPGHTITLESAGALTAWHEDHAATLVLATPIFSLSVSGHSEWKQTQAPRVPGHRSRRW